MVRFFSLFVWGELLAVQLCSEHQELFEVLRNEKVKSSLEWIDASENRAVETLISLASIVSPSGKERDRALFIPLLHIFGIAD